MKTKDGVWFNGSSKSRKRRTSVIDRLEKQLELRMKPVQQPGFKSLMLIPCTDKDIARITKELNILKQRI